jgi:hypothetical protein
VFRAVEADRTDERTEREGGREGERSSEREREREEEESDRFSHAAKKDSHGRTPGKRRKARRHWATQARPIERKSKAAAAAFDFTMGADTGDTITK